MCIANNGAFFHHANVRDNFKPVCDRAQLICVLQLRPPPGPDQGKLVDDKAGAPARLQSRRRTRMSLKMTTQYDWMPMARYSQYHPENCNRGKNLEKEVKLQGMPAPPPPITGFTEGEKKVDKMWGHALCCEQPTGVQETRTRIKADIKPKVGSTWARTIAFEQGTSTSCSGVYSGSMIEQSFAEFANERSKRP